MRTVADGRVAGAVATGMGRTLSGEARGVNGFAQLLQQSHRKPQESRLLARCSGVAPALFACCYDGVTMGLRWGFDGSSKEFECFAT